MKNYFLFIGLSILIGSCSYKSTKNKGKEDLALGTSVYKGTASITQGLAKTIEERIHECDGGRKTDIGTIKSTDGKEWIVPAITNFKNKNFPLAHDLYNPCNGNSYSNVQEAIAMLDSSDIIEIDQGGDLFID